MSANGDDNSAGDPEGEARVREVYARYGLALYESQVLERGLAIALSTVFGPPNQSAEDYDSYLRTRFLETFGRLSSRLADSNAGPGIVAEIERCVEKRNWLAHRYFWERAVSFTTAAGQTEMLAELVECAAEFQRADERLTLLKTTWATEHGIDLQSEMDDVTRTLLLDGVVPYVD